MASTPQSAEPLETRANRLYWESTDTVDEVASQLGISRSALYGVVDPLPVDGACPECGGRMVFMNRSQRSSGQATCSGCGARFDLDALAAEREHALAADADWEASLADDRPGWAGELAGVSAERVLMIGGAAALGILAGIAVARVARRIG
jgi:hypothetical protein